MLTSPSLTHRISGNTSGATALISTGTMVLAGGNNITLSQNGNSVTISAPTPAAQSNQTVGLYGSSNTTLTSSGTVDARSMTFRAIGSLTVGYSNGELLFSAPAALTTAMLSNAVTLSNIKVSAGATSNLLSAITFADGSGVSFGINASTLTASVKTDYLTSQSTQFLAITMGGNTAGTTSFNASNNATIFLNGGNNITLSGNGSTITISAAAQTNQTIGLYMSSNTNLTSSGTVDARSMTFRGAGIATVGFSAGEVVVSVPAGGGAAIRGIAAGASTATENTVNFSNSNGISFGFGAAGNSTVITGSHNAYLAVSLGGNTAGTNTFQASDRNTIQLAGGNGITLSGNGSTITISGPAQITYTNFYEPFEFVDGTATSTLSLSNLGIQPFTLDKNLSFGQINFVGIATAPAISASNNWSARLTNSTQAVGYSAQYSITNSQFVDLYLFSRGSGVFSTEIETFASTRNSFITYYNVTYSASITATNTAGGSIRASQTISMSISYPFLTSGTSTSINAASTYTGWGTGYTTWTSTASNSTSDTMSTSAAKAIALASTFPATVGWSGAKLINYNFGTSLTPGEYWIGMVQYSSTSSSSSSSSQVTGAAGTGATYSVTYNASSLTQSQQHTWAGKTLTIVNSFGSLGFATTANMAPQFGLGTFSGTWTGTQTYLNNLGNPAGAVAYSQLRSGVSFFQSWFQMNSNRPV